VTLGLLNNSYITQGRAMSQQKDISFQMKYDIEGSICFKVFSKGFQAKGKRYHNVYSYRTNYYLLLLVNTVLHASKHYEVYFFYSYHQISSLKVTGKMAGN
jgi:hypothetical protein